MSIAKHDFFFEEHIKLHVCYIGHNYIELYLANTWRVCRIVLLFLVYKCLLLVTAFLLEIFLLQLLSLQCVYKMALLFLIDANSGLEVMMHNI